MPVTLPSKFRPLANSLTGNTTFRRRVKQFDDGYKQVSAVGVNADIRELPLTFIVDTLADYQELMGIFRQLKGVDHLIYQHPGSSSSEKWLVSNVRDKYINGQVWEIQATLEKWYG